MKSLGFKRGACAADQLHWHARPTVDLVRGAELVHPGLASISPAGLGIAALAATHSYEIDLALHFRQ